MSRVPTRAVPHRNRPWQEQQNMLTTRTGGWWQRGWNHKLVQCNQWLRLASWAAGRWSLHCAGGGRRAAGRPLMVESTYTAARAEPAPRELWPRAGLRRRQSELLEGGGGGRRRGRTARGLKRAGALSSVIVVACCVRRSVQLGPTERPRPQTLACRSQSGACCWPACWPLSFSSGGCLGQQQRVGAMVWVLKHWPTCGGHLKKYFKDILDYLHLVLAQRIQQAANNTLSASGPKHGGGGAEE